MIHDTRYRNKKVIVMGLGLHGGGVGTVKFFAGQGARVLVTDLKDKAHLAGSLKKLEKFPVKYILGRHRPEDFENADLIVKGPGIPTDSPYLRIARLNNIPVDTDIGIFFELCRAPIIGITGSKGKSTTAYLLSLMLSQKPENKVWLAGNIRTSVFEILPKIKKNDLVVLELSSFELEDMAHHKKSPHIALVTNILRDHQDRYPDLPSYLAAKKPIFKFQKPGDFLFLNRDDKITRSLSEEAPGKVVFFSRRDLDNGKLDFLKKTAFKFPGYVRQNIAAAAAVADLLKIRPALMLRTVKNFRGLEGRGEEIMTVNGVKFINDTCATMPDASIAILESLKPSAKGDKKVVLICGGTDKRLDFKKFVEILPGCVKFLILLPGTATEKIKTALSKSGKKIPTAEIRSMEEAVATASEKAGKGDVVLLSPAAASFGLFQNEFDRGDNFKYCVSRLKNRNLR